MSNSASIRAIHEAGHALACLLFGGNVPRVSIDYADGESGLTTTHLPDDHFGARMVTTIAGPVAESIYTGRNLHKCLSSDSSLTDYGDLIRQVEAEYSLEQVYFFDVIDDFATFAKSLLLRRGVREAVCFLATRLDAELTIEGLTIHNIFPSKAPAIHKSSIGFEKLQKAAAMLWGEGGEYP